MSVIVSTYLGLATLAATAPEGFRQDLAAGAKLFVPAGWQGRDGRVNVVLHLHGTPGIAEPALVEAGWDAVLVTFNRKGLSSAYSKPFSDADLFPKILDEAFRAVSDREPGVRRSPGRVVVSSFSAGFGGVREILNTPSSFDRIESIVLADSLYCGYAGDPKERRVDPALMAGFERFAREAAAGRKALLISHSSQVPPGYGSTTETADYLLKAVDVVPDPTELDRGGGWRQTRTASKGRLVVMGFDGEGPDDHMRHLRRIGELWKLLPDPFADALIR